MKDIENIFGRVEPFMNRIFQNINDAKISLDTIGIEQIDHIGVRTKNKDQFVDIGNKLLDSSSADLVQTILIRERKVSTYKFKIPITYKHYIIPALELLEPAEGDSEYEFGPQHIEVVTKKPLNEILNMYSHLTWKLARPESHNPELSTKFKDNTAIKFHPISLLEAARIEKELGITKM